MRLAARECQAFRSKVHQLELSLERLRDRATLPNPEAVRSQITARWGVVWQSAKGMEKSLADYLGMFV